MDFQSCRRLVTVSLMDAISVSSSRNQLAVCVQTTLFAKPRVKVYFSPKVWLQRKSMPYHVKRLLGCWIVRAKVHTSEASEALKTSSRSLIAVADVAFINRTPNQFKQLSSSKISWCVGETWFSPCHLSQLQSPESLMLPLFLSWLS